MEITLKYDGRNPIAQKTLEFILSLGVFKVVQKDADNKLIEKVNKGKAGKITYVKTAELWK